MEPPENNNSDDEVSGFEEAEKIILRWDATASEEAKEKMIFDCDREEVDRYLQAVDEIQKSMSAARISGDGDGDGDEKANYAVEIAMARLEDEFRSILLSQIIQQVVGKET